MEYYLLRKKFCELSGRYDLINADLTDNGADFYINAGQTHLDRLQNTGTMQAKSVQLVSAGTIKVYCAGLRAVHRVWIGTTSIGLTELLKVDLAWLKEEYAEQLSSIDQGQPYYYAPAVFRPFPDSSTTVSLSGYYDIDDLILHGTVPNHYTYSGIVIMPPPDGSYYVSILGTFYSPTLSATLSGATWTQTKSFWSEVHPDILITAALYKLETFYRNTEGAKDWKNALMIDIGDLDKDAADQESTQINQIGG